MGWIKLQEYALRQVLSTLLNQKHSPRAIKLNHQVWTNKSGAGVAPSSTYALPPWIYMWGFQRGNQNIGLGNGGISRWGKEGSIRRSSGGIFQLSGVRGVWWGWLIRRGYISSKFVKYSGCWGIWGNWVWGWVFLGSLDVSVRAGVVDLGLDWDGLFLKYGSLWRNWLLWHWMVLWEACWGYLQRMVWTGQGREKKRSGCGILDCYWHYWILRWCDWNINCGISSLQFSQINWPFMNWMVEWDKLACYRLYGTDGMDGIGLGWRYQR